MRIAHVSISTNAQAERRRFEEMLAREFYAGSTMLDVYSDFTIRCGEGINQPIRVIGNWLENARLSFRRTWDDIRRDGRNVYVLWFVRRGCMTLTQAGRSCMARAGSCLVMAAGIPFSLESWPGQHSRHESLAIIVPKHLIFSVGEKVPLAVAASAEHGDATVANNISQLLFDHGNDMSADVAEALTIASIKAMFRAIHRTNTSTSIGRSDERWLHLGMCIAAEFSDPELSIPKIAQRCNMSVRRACSLAEAHGTTISRLLWKTRLEKARSWLQALPMKNRSTSEIAHLAGFKSAAHFSRRFRDEYGLSPSEFRRSHCEQSSGMGESKGN